MILKIDLKILKIDSIDAKVEVRAVRFKGSKGHRTRVRVRSYAVVF